MRTAELKVAVLKALDAARPDATLTALRPVLGEFLNATEVNLFVANYQLTGLRPIGEPDQTIGLQDTTAGQAFVLQRPAVGPPTRDGTAVYLPISVRGDRIGVLQLRLPSTPGAVRLQHLTEMATVVGYALNTSARQTDALDVTARSQRLTLAAELQWQLLPGRGCRAPEYRIAGHLEPAYHVHADNFDWSQNGDQLLISVTDAARPGAVGALLTTLAVTALRNGRRTELHLADQASLADQAVYAHHQGSQYISTLLVRIDLSSGEASAVRAGSPLLLCLRNGQTELIELTDQLPLGMFEGTVYTEQRFTVATGDRLVLVSDGIHAARSPRNEVFGLARLQIILRDTADLTPDAVVRTIMDNLMAHHEHAELKDDAAVICLDWTGPGAGHPFNGAGLVGAHPSGAPKRPLHVVSH